MHIRAFEENDIPLVKEFCDFAIGTNYYSESELRDIWQRSQKNGHQCSFVLENQGKIRGIRITYPPGQWQKGKGQGLCPQKWMVPTEKVAYFQSIFLDPTLTGQGWGQRLSQKSLEILRELRSEAVVTHSWKESPGNSSRRYLEALGFKFVESHPLYWNKVDYFCTRCGKPCVCTAEEMILTEF